MNPETKKEPGYLGTVDLMRDGKWISANLTISEFFEPNSFKSADGAPIDKRIIGFEKTEMRMILNKTNWKTLRFIAGDSRPEKLVGLKVRVNVARFPSFGKVDVGLRLGLPPGAPANKKHLQCVGRDLTGEPVLESQQNNNDQ